jgi:hypothetical protein
MYWSVGVSFFWKLPLIAASKNPLELSLLYEIFIVYLLPALHLELLLAITRCRVKNVFDSKRFLSFLCFYGLLTKQI